MLEFKRVPLIGEGFWSFYDKNLELMSQKLYLKKSKLLIIS